MHQPVVDMMKCSGLMDRIGDALGDDEAPRSRSSAARRAGLPDQSRPPRRHALTGQPSGLRHASRHAEGPVAAAATPFCRLSVAVSDRNAADGGGRTRTALDVVVGIRKWCVWCHRDLWPIQTRSCDCGAIRRKKVTHCGFRARSVLTNCVLQVSVPYSSRICLPPAVARPSKCSTRSSRTGAHHGQQHFNSVLPPGCQLVGR